MKRVLFLAGFAGALVGCGSGLPTPPALPTFHYGAPQAADSEQGYTASTGVTTLRSASGTSGTSANPSAAPALADQLAANLPQPALRASLPSAEAALKSLPVPGGVAAGGLFRSSALVVGNPDCVHQGNTSGGSSYSITYSNCSYGGAEGGTSFNWTLNGTISVTSTSASWDIQATFDLSADGVSGKGQMHWTGQLSWTDTTINGNGKSELAARVEGQGEKVDIGITSGWTAALQLDATHCVSGGTLEVGRAMEGSASNGQHVSGAHGWKFTWTGCDTYQVAEGT
ncbi:MAG TPA: hypothetical protein VFN91_05250 [Myxococcaceae bacterium]|nr:hypothetical protein [Myxococcaceae bacterium]